MESQRVGHDLVTEQQPQYRRSQSTPKSPSTHKMCSSHLCVTEGSRSHRNIANALWAQGLWAISASNYFDFSIQCCQKLRN